MRECKKCRVNILDDTAVCPLCSSVLVFSSAPWLLIRISTVSRTKSTSKEGLVT